MPDPSTPPADLEQLGKDVVAVAVLRGTFVLRSGRTSSYYIDKYQLTTRPNILRRLGAALAPLVPSGTDRLAGPVLGAVPLVTAISLSSDLPTVFVRTERKEHGTSKALEGNISPGERVTIVEDVVTTGGAALDSLHLLRAAGADVAAVLAVVDREEGGAEAIRAEGVPFHALFTRSQLGLEPS